MITPFYYCTFSAVWAKITDYDFDSQDRLTSMDYPSSLSVSIIPNAYGEPESVGSYASGIQYHPNGSIKSLTYGNGRVYTTTQNARQLPLELKVKDGGTNIAKLTHYYDANANITLINDGVTSAANRSMTYDNVDRLKTASGIWGSGFYTYDSLGNIKTKNEGSGTVSITYDSNNLVNVATINGNSKSYGHDARGNVINNGNQAFTYNMAGNMVTSSSPSITNWYDGHRRRVRVQEGSNTEYNMYGQGGTLLHKKDGGVQTDYIYAGSLLIAKNEGSNLHHLHTDLLGSPIDGKVGSTSYTENYSAWGEKLDNPIQLADDIGYTGHQSDIATGLTYMQARYYDPVIGRFLAVDPVKFYGGNPGQFGRYTYANNNPIVYNDPDGREAATMTMIGACAGPQGAACVALAAGAVAVGAVGYTAYKAGGAIYDTATDLIYNSESSGADADEGGESEEPGESEDGEKVKETFPSLEAAVGSVNPLDDVELEGKTKNPGLKEQGFTEKWSGTDSDGVIQSGFTNPETGEWTGGHESSKNDKY